MERKRIIATLGGSGLQYSGTELIGNPGFETDGPGGSDVFASWTEAANSGVIAKEETLVHSGSSALKFTTGAVANTYIQQTITVTADVLHVLIFWTRGDGTNAGVYGLQQGSDPYTDIITSQSTGIPGVVYTAVVRYFTPPTTSVILSVVSPPAEGGIAYFDDFAMREVTS